MFSDKINWIDLIFPRLPDEAEKRNSASAEKRAEESTKAKISCVSCNPV